MIRMRIIRFGLLFFSADRLFILAVYFVCVEEIYPNLFVFSVRYVLVRINIRYVLTYVLNIYVTNLIRTY